MGIPHVVKWEACICAAGVAKIPKGVDGLAGEDARNQEAHIEERQENECGPAGDVCSTAHAKYANVLHDEGALGQVSGRLVGYDGQIKHLTIFRISTYFSRDLFIGGKDPPS